MNNLEPLFGRLLVLFIYCSVILSTNSLSSLYKMEIAKKTAEQFISESYESGLNSDLCMNFTKIEATLGYTLTFSLVGKDRIMSDEEILTYIKEQPLIFTKDEFLSCTLKGKKSIIRIGGR